MSLTEQTLPEWQEKFLSYKDLKKQLKLIYPNKWPRLDDDGKEVNDFVNLLEKEIDKFNTFFIEKEEDYIIQLKVSFSFPHLFFARIAVDLTYP